MLMLYMCYMEESRETGTMATSMCIRAIRHSLRFFMCLLDILYCCVPAGVGGHHITGHAMHAGVRTTTFATPALDEGEAKSSKPAEVSGHNKSTSEIGKA